MVLLKVILFVFSSIEKIYVLPLRLYAYSMSTTVTVTGHYATHDSPTSVIFLIN